MSNDWQTAAKIGERTIRDFKDSIVDGSNDRPVDQFQIVALFTIVSFERLGNRLKGEEVQQFSEVAFPDKQVFEKRLQNTRDIAAKRR